MLPEYKDLKKNFLCSLIKIFRKFSKWRILVYVCVYVKKNKIAKIKWKWSVVVVQGFKCKKIKTTTTTKAYNKQANWANQKEKKKMYVVLLYYMALKVKKCFFVRRFGHMHGV